MMAHSSKLQDRHNDGIRVGHPWLSGRRLCGKHIRVQRFCNPGVLRRVSKAEKGVVTLGGNTAGGDEALEQFGITAGRGEAPGRPPRRRQSAAVRRTTTGCRRPVRWCWQIAACSSFAQKTQRAARCGADHC